MWKRGMGDGLQIEARLFSLSLPHQWIEESMVSLFPYSITFLLLLASTDY